MNNSNNTARSFKDKWENNRDLAFTETLREDSDIGSWILKRNGWGSHAGLRAYLLDKKRILDGGCGNGRVTALLCEHRALGTEVMGIDLVAADVARKNLEDYENVTTRQKDLLSDLTDIGQFDFIYCQEVLHHTNDPRGAFRNLCDRLAPGGEIAIYVYKIKAPIREFTDDFVRGKIAALPYEEAMAACSEITELGRVLAETGGKITVPTVNILGIEAGEYDLQRFIYHFFMKCFWNSAFSLEDNTAINYDWYHPQNCTRHEPEEIRSWFFENSLDVTHECVDHYGITMCGVKAGS